MSLNILKKIRPDYIFVSALLVIPAFIFQDNVLLKWLHVFMFMFFSVLAGKKIRIIPNIIMLAGITAANLLTPLGEVIFYIMKFPVTKGALYSGLEKSALLSGMIYISRIALSGDFHLSRNRRNILSDLFYYFERIMEGESRNSGKHRNRRYPVKRAQILHPAFITDFIRSTDRKLFELENCISENVPYGTSEEQPEHSSLLSLIYLFIFAAANWLIYSFRFF